MNVIKDLRIYEIYVENVIEIAYYVAENWFHSHFSPRLELWSFSSFISMDIFKWGPKVGTTDTCTEFRNRAIPVTHFTIFVTGRCINYALTNQSGRNTSLRPMTSLLSNCVLFPIWRVGEPTHIFHIEILRIRSNSTSFSGFSSVVAIDLVGEDPDDGLGDGKCSALLNDVVGPPSPIFPYISIFPVLVNP